MVNPPIHRASTILFPCVADFYKSQESGGSRPIYGRQGTSNNQELSEALAKLEGGKFAYVTPSGLSAITTTLLTFLQPGDHMLVVDSVYFYVRDFIECILKKNQVDVTFYDPCEGEDIEKLFQPNTKILYTESPGSITFELQDIPLLTKKAHKKGIKVILDNTWATGLYFPAFSHNVDIVILSATKYIIGHSDTLLGAIVCRDKEIKNALEVSITSMGVCASPDDCYMGLRGLRTLNVRLAQHQKNALTVAEWLDQQPEVKMVMHPAYPKSKSYKIWKRDFTGASGVFSILLEESPNDAVGVLIDNLKLFGIGLSWGGYESLVLPVKLKGYRKYWHEMGHTIRFHIGLESPEDLILDLQQAFDKYRKYLHENR